MDMFFSSENGLYISYKHADEWRRSVMIVPDWMLNFFQKVEGEDKTKCTLCEETFTTDLKSSDHLEHLKNQHNDIYKLHDSNQDAGFHIEFINFSVLKEDKSIILGNEEEKSIVLSEVIGAMETVEGTEPTTEKSEEVGLQYVLVEKKKKRKIVHGSPESRKRSWVWKYFTKLSSIIYRCNLCYVLLSIKGCNTNNMNRHMRTRHPADFRREVSRVGNMELGVEVETPYAIATEEIYATDNSEKKIRKEKDTTAARRSWIWLYFERVTSTLAKCRMCNRHISHGGNATGNMNRHLKMIHNKSSHDELSNNWVWKVIDLNAEDNTYTCKICQSQGVASTDTMINMTLILQHMKREHGVDSGDQIITSADWTV